MQNEEQAEAMLNAIDQNRRMLKACPNCGGAAGMEYEAGTTRIQCAPGCPIVCLPDWQPKEAREAWNLLQRKPRQRKRP